MLIILFLACLASVGTRRILRRIRHVLRSPPRLPDMPAGTQRAHVSERGRRAATQRSPSPSERRGFLAGRQEAGSTIHNPPGAVKRHSRTRGRRGAGAGRQGGRCPPRRIHAGIHGVPWQMFSGRPEVAQGRSTLCRAVAAHEGRSVRPRPIDTADWRRLRVPRRSGGARSRGTWADTRPCTPAAFRTAGCHGPEAREPGGRSRERPRDNVLGRLGTGTR